MPGRNEGPFVDSVTSWQTFEREAGARSEDTSGRKAPVGQERDPADSEKVRIDSGAATQVTPERTPYNTALPDPPTPPYPSALFCWDTQQQEWVQEPDDESDGFWSDGPPNMSTPPRGVFISLAEAAARREEVHKEAVHEREEVRRTKACEDDEEDKVEQEAVPELPPVQLCPLHHLRMPSFV